MKIVPFCCRCLNSSPSLPGPELEREFKSFLRDSQSSSQQCQKAQRELMKAVQAAQDSAVMVSEGEWRVSLCGCITCAIFENCGVLCLWIS